MPIPGVCPSCGSKFDLVHALTDAEARLALGAALELPAPLAKLIVPYMALHAPQGKAMAWSKLARLLREITEQVTSGQVMRKQITYAAPLDLWKNGIEEMLAARDTGSLVLPLSGHGYLTEVVWRMAAKATNSNTVKTEQKISHPSHRIYETESSKSPRLTELNADLAHLKRINKNGRLDDQITKREQQIQELTGEN